MSDYNSTDPMKAGSRPKVVFFVDDDDQLRRVTARILESRGYEVLLAASAAEASEVIETHDAKIDVLLMDIHLPDGYGATVAARLMEAHSEMALVFTTGLAGVDPVLAGGLNAADFAVTKPFSADQLVDVLERAMAANS